MQAKFRACAWSAAHINSAPMHLGDMLYDRKAQARSAHFTGSRSIDPVKPLEDSWDVIGWNPQTIIGNFYEHLIIDLSDRHGNRTTLVGVLDRIVDKIGNCSIDVIGIARNPRQIDARFQPK